MRHSASIQEKILDDVPPIVDGQSMYRIRARTQPHGSREERTDRNKPLVFPELQSLIHEMTFAVLGSGGIGGHVVDSLARLLPKRVVVVDSGIFDISNIHRQYAARFTTIGKSKALETARLIREIAPDIEIVICTQGSTPDTVYRLLEGADLAIDAIEYHRIGARYEAMCVAEEIGLPVLNGNSVGFGTHLHFWPHAKDSSGKLIHPSFREVCPFDQEYAYHIENRIAAGTCSQAEYDFCCHTVNSIYLPNIPNYGDTVFNTRELFIQRLFVERTACIVSTNPKKAAGFLANHVLFYLAESLGTKNKWQNVPKLAVFPEYVYEDDALRIFEVHSLNLKTIRNELSRYMPR